MGQRSFTDRFIETIRDWIPGVLRQAEETGRETVQVVVWLVGLASALLALEATNRALLSGLSITGRFVATFLLVGVAVLGVLQRIVYHIAEAKQRELILRLQGHLAGLTTNVDEPFELQQWWDRAEIIKQLLRGFDLHYDFLGQDDVPIEKCREIYSNHYDRWKSFESQRLNDFGELMGAFMGKPKGKGREVLGLEIGGADHLEIARGMAMSVNRWTRASYLCFYACCTCFVAGLVMVAWALVP
jgi:hypothetical protein